MNDEHVKFEGRLAVNRRERAQLQLRMQGLLRSIRDLLDPTVPVDGLDWELAAAQATDGANLQIQVHELKGEAQAIKNALGK
jgi:hypothetical protein